MYKFGLIGKNISYSFSKDYFTKKFQKLQLENYQYSNFDIQSITEITTVLTEPNLKGLNVTIPYKEEILTYLDEIDAEAKEIGAVNTIKVTDGKLKGFNTDVYGFEASIIPFLEKYHTKALILGTGGASKAVSFALQKFGIEVLFVSRKPSKKNEISYNDLSKEIVEMHKIIVNCSPIGTHPTIDDCPNIPYQYLSSEHLLYDLIYNPSQTLFLLKGLEKGCAISNGLKMLELQAERAWEIWNA